MVSILFAVNEETHSLQAAPLLQTAVRRVKLANKGQIENKLHG